MIAFEKKMIKLSLSSCQIPIKHDQFSACHLDLGNFGDKNFDSESFLDGLTCQKSSFCIE